MPAHSLLLVAMVLSLDLDPLKTDFYGTFRLKRGSVHYNPESGKISGAIVVDVPSGASGKTTRDPRMQKEVLESQRYPEAMFTPDRVDGKLAPEGPSQIAVHGVFNIHGADHELMLHFQVERAAGRYIASTHFTIPNVQWGMKDPSNFLLKVDKTVDMDIKTTINADR